MQSSTWYKTQMDSVEIELANESIKLAGIKSTGSGQSKIEFENRVIELQKLKDYWEQLYNEALAFEQGTDGNLFFIPRRESGY